MTEQTFSRLQRVKQDPEEAVDEAEEKADSSLNDDNDLEHGLMTREDFVKLVRFIKDTPVVHEKIVQINGEDLLEMFNASVLYLSEEDNELVEDKKLTFLYYVIRNSIILNLNEDTKKVLQPLSNLALSTEMLSGFVSLVERNLKLKEIISNDVDQEYFTFISRVVENCKESRETFVQDTFQAEKLIILYHTLRNKVLTVLVAQLHLFMTNISNVVVSTEDQSVAQIRIIMSLPWNQQVIAFEAMNFSLPFLESFQAFLLLSLVNPKKAKTEQTRQTSPGKQQPSY